MDFIIFNYDESGKITNINKIAKDYTTVACYYPYNSVFVGGLKMAKVVKSHGYFDYSFTTTLPDSKQEVLISRNMLSAKPYIGIMSIDVGKESVTHKIPVKKSIATNYKVDWKGIGGEDVYGMGGTGRKKESGLVGAIQSKPGYLCIYYYDKKERTVHIYLEKIQM